jgi:hypothetical protein
MREVFVRKPTRRFEAIPVADVLKRAVEIDGKSRLEKNLNALLSLTLTTPALMYCMASI